MLTKPTKICKFIPVSNCLGENKKFSPSVDFDYDTIALSIFLGGI
jgi:hypothetical protein